MQSTTLVIAFVTVQQGIFALGWLQLAVVLKLVRGPSLQWALSAVVGAVGVALITLRGTVPDWLGYPVAAWLVVLMSAGTRRGVQLFVGTDTGDREQGVMLVLAALALGLFSLQDPKGGGVVLTTSATISWTMLRIAQVLYGRLRGEFSARTRVYMSLPFGVLGLAFGFRTLASLSRPDLYGRPLNMPSAFNEALALVLLMVGLVMHLSLGFLVLARIIGELRKLSMHDSLTGLLNRRALRERLDEAWLQAQRNGEPFALLMLDIDHFKLLNDRHGHAAGDAALVALADELRRGCRSVDHAARLGGEEFCVLLPRCDSAGAMQVAERMRQGVQSLQPAWAGQPLAFTISLGVATTDHLGGEFLIESLMRRADDALYQAKRTGRNKVVLADVPDAAEALDGRGEPRAAPALSADTKAAAS